MGTFHPYSVHYLELGRINAVDLPPGQAFLVVMHKDTPLGHVWIQSQTVRPGPGFIEQVIAAIRPAMNFYNSKRAQHPEDWEAFIREGNRAELERFLEGSLNPSLLNNEAVVPKEISVVICTRNRREALKGCIESLLNSSDPDFELIIVDNAPDDDSTERLVKSYRSARYIREDRKGLDIARNTGAQHASHDIIAYTDDDVLVSEDWVKKLKACFSDPGTMSVTGQVFPLRLDTEAQYIFERYWGFNKGYVPLVFDQQYFSFHQERGVPVWDIGAGANMAFRKTAFSLAGYFDERLDVGAAGCSGDSEMWYRLLARGGNCRYYPHLYVYHKHRETKKELQKQLYNYMRGFVAALLVQHEKFGHTGNLRRLYKITPKWYFNRLKSAVKGKKEGFIFSELRGYISGWKFYQSNKKKPVEEGIR